MSDLFEQGNLKPFSVGELSGAIKAAIGNAFGRVQVRGEISQPKVYASSGHLYLRLKDPASDAVLDAVCWKGQVAKLGFAAEHGMDVLATGKLTTYPGKSSYQLVIETMTLAGAGAILKLIEERKARLAAEGLFARERKRRPPYLPGVVGVVTSPSGAVIRDILHRLADRFPRRVIVWPSAVQGPQAAQQIAAGIEGLNRIPPNGPIPRPDVIIVARGGGSLDELMAFNEEIVVRAAAASRIPLISAVGHETDTTLIDFAADLRAPTPTAAAEMAVPVRAELLAILADRTARLTACGHRRIAAERDRLSGLGRGLADPRQILDAAAQRLDDRGERLVMALGSLVDRRRQTLAALAGRLATRLALAAQALIEQHRRLTPLAERMAPGLARMIDGHARHLTMMSARLDAASPLAVLARGYVMVTDAAGHPVTSAAALPGGTAVELHFADGRRGARLDGGS